MFPCRIHNSRTQHRGCKQFAKCRNQLDEFIKILKKYNTNSQTAVTMFPPDQRKVSFADRPLQFQLGSDGPHNKDILYKGGIQNEEKTLFKMGQLSTLFLEVKL